MGPSLNPFSWPKVCSKHKGDPIKTVICDISFSRVLLFIFLGGPRSRGASRGNRGNRNGNNRAKYAEDFDFEEANSKFHKEEIEKELLKVLKKVKIEDEVRDGNHIFSNLV